MKHPWFVRVAIIIATLVAAAATYVALDTRGAPVGVVSEDGARLGFQFPSTVAVGGMPVFNVTSYGAVHDGATNDRAAIKAAFVAAAAVNGAIVFFPAGTYIVDKDPSLAGALDLSQSNLVLMGIRGKSIIKLKAGQALTPVYTLRVTGDNVVIRDMVIDGNWGNAQTTVVAASHNAQLPTGTINVTSTADFPNTAACVANPLRCAIVIETITGSQYVKYTGTTATTFTGASGGTAILQGGNMVGLADGNGGICTGTITAGVCSGGTSGHTTQASNKTTIAVASNGISLPQAVINVVSTAGWPNTPPIGPGNFIVLTDLGYQTVNCTAVGSATTLTGCTLGVGQMATGNEVYNNSDPQSHALSLRGATNFLLESSIIRQAYGDCIYSGYSPTSVLLPARNITIRDTKVDMCARQGMSMASWVEGVTIDGVNFGNAYGQAIDVEPVEQPVRDVSITHSVLSNWWGQQNPGRSTQYALTIEGGKAVLMGQTVNARKFRVHDNTINGTVLIENTVDVQLDSNRIINDWTGYGPAPILISMFEDNVWVTNNYVYDRTSYPGSPATGNSSNATNHDAAIQIAFYGGGNQNKQPAGVHVTGNDIHVRNGHHGIKAEGEGGFAFSNGAMQGPATGTATGATITTLTDSGATWTVDQWIGYQVYMGNGYVADIISNTSTVLTLFLTYNLSGSHTNGWYTYLGEPAPIPALGVYRITQISGLTDISNNTVDLSDDGNGAGGYGVWLRSTRAGSRVIVRDNMFKNANTVGVKVEAVYDSNRTIEFLQVTDNHAYDDQLTPTCAATVNFGSVSYIRKMIVRGNTNDVGCTAAVTGLTSGVWLINDGNVQEWAGYGTPDGVVTAPIGSTFKRLDGSGSTASYTKTSGTGNTTWLAAGGAVTAVAGTSGVTCTGTTSASCSVTGLAAGAANAIITTDGTGGSTWKTTANLTALSTTGHVDCKGTAPALTSCGSGATVVGDDCSGTVTEGTVATGCIATFAAAYGAEPTCTITSEAGLGFTYSKVGAAITIVNVGALSSTKLDYVCHGH